MTESRFTIREVLPGEAPTFAVYAIAEPPYYADYRSVLFFTVVAGEEDEIVPMVFVGGEGIIPADEAPGELFGLYRSGVETAEQIKTLMTQAQAAGQRRYQALHPPAPPAPEPPLSQPRQRQRTRRRGRHPTETPTAAE